MKLLILAATPGLLRSNNKYNGGGWIASLQREIMNSYADEIKVSLAYHSDVDSHEVYDGVDYYGIKSIKHTFWNYKKKEEVFCNKIRDVIETVKPDVILCFGTENGLGLACSITDIPVIIHIQGILNPLFEAWLPQGLSWRRWLWGNKQNIAVWLALRKIKPREIKMFKRCKYFLGRTEWDKRITNLLAPQAKYFYCSEMLRNEIFTSTKTWSPSNHNKKKIVTIISGAIYKGGDVILRSAKIMKENVDFNFIWEVYGVDNMNKWEKLTGINHASVNIDVKGVINATQLVEIINSADVYVHPSYMENSPNTVCEAQLLGIPVIATNAGGTSSLINHDDTGILVPANDPFLMASYIKKLICDVELSTRLGVAGRKAAIDRHNPKRIVEDLYSILYQVVYY